MKLVFHTADFTLTLITQIAIRHKAMVVK